MSPLKESTVRRPGYSAAWTPSEIDECYRAHFSHTGFSGGPDGTLLREAAPIYPFFPGIAAELKRHNSTLRLIFPPPVPVERAISHCHMENGRGRKQRSPWLALLLEPFKTVSPGGAETTRLRGEAAQLPRARALRTTVAQPLPLLRRCRVRDPLPRGSPGAS